MGQLISTVGRFSKRNITRTAETDPDDKWSNLHREREKNHLYKIVGTRSGGELIEVYEKEGQEGVLRFAAERLAPAMYNDGEKPQELTFAEFMKWKSANARDLGKPEDANYQAEWEKRFVTHPVQYKMNKRGLDGETVIHLLLARGEPICTEIARILLKRYPGLAVDFYEGDEMFGQSALHLAIVHDECDIVQLLLECGANVNARACGEFFLPEDQKNGIRSVSNYQGYAYYGEYPLAFAACFGNKDIYDLLIQYGADPNMQDIFGNTILHMCVIRYSNSMYSYAVRHWRKPAHQNVTNYCGMTPLTLATKLGRKDIFEKMLDLMKVEFWRFGDITCSAYPLTALDTIRPDGSTNYESALMTVINGTTKEHLDMIGSEVIQRLIADKWKCYAKWKLYQRLGHLILHTVFLCFVIYTRPTENSRITYEEMYWDDHVRFVFEIFLVLSCIYFVFIQQFGEMKTQGFYRYIRNLKTAPAKVVFFCACICLLLCVPCRLLKLVRIEEAFLVFALPGSWIFFLFFARVLKSTGPFVQMIYSMIAGDMVRFALIATIFLVSFSQVFYFFGKDMSSKQKLDTSNPHNCPITGIEVYTYSSILETFITLFRATMSGYDYEEFGCSNYQPFSKILFVLFMFIMPVTMLNILIAMMGNTYTKVIVQAEKAWKQQYAQIVMVLERSFRKEELAEYQLKYSISLREEFEGGMDVRGLMVYKQTEKTRAQQKRQALCNWKTIGRKVLNIIRIQGAEKASYILHSNERILDEQNEIMPNTSSVPPTRDIAIPSRLSCIAIPVQRTPPDDIIIENEMRNYSISRPGSSKSQGTQSSCGKISDNENDVETAIKQRPLRKFRQKNVVIQGIPNIPNMPSENSIPRRVPLVQIDMFIRQDSSGTDGASNANTVDNGKTSKTKDDATNKSDILILERPFEQAYQRHATVPAVERCILPNIPCTIDVPPRPSLTRNDIIFDNRPVLGKESSNDAESTSIDDDQVLKVKKTAKRVFQRYCTTPAIKIPNIPLTGGGDTNTEKPLNSSKIFTRNDSYGQSGNESDSTSTADSTMGRPTKRVYQKHFLVPEMEMRNIPSAQNLPAIPNMPATELSPPRLPLASGNMFLRNESESALHMKQP